MKYKSFIKKLKRRLGNDILIQTDESFSQNRKEWCVYDDRVLSWRVENYASGEDPKVWLFHSRRVGDEKDPMTDYFPGTHWKNATQMLDSACPPPPKFVAGSLVKGKENKRAKRLGYNGKVGLVMRNTGYGQMIVNFSENSTPSSADRGVSNQYVTGLGYVPTFSERDFDLVSGVTSA